MPDTRAMTNQERRRLVTFVLSREWLLLAIGVLTMGVSLSNLLSSHTLERIAGLVLALLLLVAMALFVWIKLRRDLAASKVEERDVTIVEKHQTRGEATHSFWLVDQDGVEYEAPHRWYTRVEPGQMYRLTFSYQLRIVLSVERNV